MKKGLTALAIVGGISLFGYAIYRYFTKQIDLLQQFTWKVVDFTFDTADLKVIKGIIKFRFSSISDIELTISKFYLDVYVNGDRIGYVEDAQTFIIPARGYTDIPLAYTVNPQFILKNVVDIILTSTKLNDAIIGFDGYAQVKSGFISATVPIKSSCSAKNMECSLG
jgi:LEA14-like dessication related protein